MNTHSNFPDQLHWTSHDLANAVPLRLFEMFAFDATLADAAVGPCANQTTRRHPWPGSYLPPAPPSARFRVHS